jgi:tRNA A22 N-methylase
LYARYSKKYNIPFLDYSDDEICYKKEYFYNASHLNKTGSDLFMQKFIRDLRYSDQIYRDSLFIEK